MHTQTYTHKHTTYTHTLYTHTHTLHTHTHTCIHTNTPKRTYRPHACTHIHMHTHTHTYFFRDSSSASVCLFKAKRKLLTLKNLDGSLWSTYNLIV